MTDQKETATTTMWQDQSQRETAGTPADDRGSWPTPSLTLGANANVADCDNILAPAKLFSPYSELDVVHHRNGP